ncbi:transcriptional Coactivator p15-domain-containing protein [Russula vinacea]|nr:transcriptional Coactivator p15-domain-containing protein [Russula vinacea]
MGKSSKESSKISGSKRSSKSGEPSEQKFKDSSKRKATEKDVSDGDDNAQHLDEATQPATKTVKKPRIALRNDEDDTDSDSDSEDIRTKLQKNSEGDMYVDLGKKKRVTVRSFKGTTLVDIREYYGNEGDEKPGKKGIALSVEQWKCLVQASGSISDLL